MHDIFLDFISLGKTADPQTSSVSFRLYEQSTRKGRARRGLKSLSTVLEANRCVVTHGALPAEIVDIVDRKGGIIIETGRLARILLPGCASFTREALAHELDLPAGDDAACMNADTYLALCERAASLDRETTALIVSLLSAAGDRDHAEFFTSLAAREPDDTVPGAGDAPEADHWRGSGPGVTGEMTGFIRVEEADVRGVLGKGGSLSGVFDGFEERPEQLEMAKAVMDCVNEGTVLLAEAGTGTGKSFAYLVPLIFCATLNGARAVVSTNTKNLQEQLFEKDLPTLESVMPYPFRYGLLKGRQNYLCRSRFDEFLGSRGVLPREEDAERLLSLIVWSRTTATGDVSEIKTFDPRQAPGLWSKLQCDARSCPLRSGPVSKSCFLKRARDKALRSHIIIVNHALLLSDLTIEGGILGEYRSLVVDEAHNLEKAAQDQLGKSTGPMDLYQFFERSFGGDRDFRLPVRRRGGGESGVEELRRLAKDLSERVRSCRREVRRFFDALPGLVGDRGEKGTAADTFARKVRFRRGDDTSSGLKQNVVPLEASLDGLQSVLAEIVGRMEPAGEDPASEESPSRRRDLAAALEELSEIRQTLDFLIQGDSDSWVYWVELGGAQSGARAISLRACPVAVGPVLRDLLFDRVRSVTFSSATMSVGGDYAFTANTLGVDLLEPGRAGTFDGGTSFSLDRQVLLLFPTFMPSVLDPSFVDRLPELILSLQQRIDGGALVLFTSRDWLKRTYVPLRELCHRENITCLAQSEDGSREALLERFRGDERAILLGTDSFWEGIDVPGVALELVVIVRLPFPVPSEPVLEALAEHMTARGEDPFTGYALPKTALRLKQGFGRLIRTRNDRGTVVVLDRRIVEKRYGRYLQQALPVKPRVVGTEEDLLLLLERWQDGLSVENGEVTRTLEIID